MANDARWVDPERLRAGLAELGEKYRLLDALTAGEPGRTLQRRDAIREIAERFPAAMREWDEAPAAELRRRGDEIAHLLQIAEQEPGRLGQALALPGRAWIRYALDLHQRLRDGLRIKRWLRGRPLDDALIVEAAREFAVAPARLRALAAPPAGRWSALVYSEIAAEHDITMDELKAALFPRHDP